MKSAIFGVLLLSSFSVFSAQDNLASQVRSSIKTQLQSMNLITLLRIKIALQSENPDRKNICSLMKEFKNRFNTITYFFDYTNSAYPLPEFETQVIAMNQMIGLSHFGYPYEHYCTSMGSEEESLRVLRVYSELINKL